MSSPSSQWDMAFSMAPSTINSPPMAMNNPAQGLQTPVSTQYPIQYGAPTKVTPVAPAQPMPQSQVGGPVVFTARDWQQSVASVYDPNGLKRRWNSMDLEAEHNSKRQR